MQNETVTMYSQALGYDAFGNLTSRETDVWGDEGGFSAVYANGRKLNGDEIYDNVGNLVSNPIATNVYDGWAFDASGRNVRTVMAWDESLQRRKDVISNLLDGDGRAVKRVDLKETWVHSAPPEYLSSTKAEYYIRSSVLGGKVLTELRENGAKKQTNVYTGEAVIAEQMSFPADAQHSTEWGFVNWKHEDPVTGSYNRKRADGTAPTGSEPLPNAELEPLGGRIPDEDPYDPTIPPPAGLRDFRYNGGDVFRPEYGCIVDGFVQDGPGLCTRMFENGSGRLNSNYDLLPAVASGLNIYAVPRAIGNNDAPTPPGVRPDSSAESITSASYATTLYEYDYIFGGAVPAFRDTSAVGGGGSNMTDNCRLMVGKLREIMAQSLNAIGPIKDMAGVDQFVNAIDSAFHDLFVGQMNFSSTQARQNNTPGQYLGDTGFKPEFKDSLERYSDQTHHFAAYFHAGIWATESWKAYAHSLTDKFTNQGDINLGNAAFDLGVTLRTQQIGSQTRMNRNNPRFPFPEKVPIYESWEARRNRVFGISDTILNKICD